MTQIKVCGLRPGDDLSFVAQSAVSHVGVVFVPSSKRYVEPRQAARITTAVGQNARIIGVFSDFRVDDILRALEESKAHGAQLHGNESVAVCDELRRHGFTVWKALRITSEMTGKQVFEAAVQYVGVANALLFDAAPPAGVDHTVTGGHGVPFDWKVLQSIDGYAKQQHINLPPLWVAGGLNSENVAQLLQTVQPFGVDVSSGVETAARKDPQRIEAFIKAVQPDDSSLPIPN